MLARLISIITLTIILSNCTSQPEYDPALQVPDIDANGDSHGYSMTPLGLLLYHPWGYDMKIGGYNEKSTTKEGYTISKNIDFDTLQKQLVFEFQRNGTLNYWFKKDYLISPDTIVINAGGQKTFSHTFYPTNKLKLKNKYTGGNWKANFADSTITIDFGRNDFGLRPINGKLIDLSNIHMQINWEELDSSKREKLTQLTFEHY